MRTVVYERTFDDQLNSLEPNFERADDFISGAEWILSRNPEFGTLVDEESFIWFLPILDIFETSLGISYTFNDEYVYCLSIFQTEDGVEEDI